MAIKLDMGKAMIEWSGLLSLKYNIFYHPLELYQCRSLSLERFAQVDTMRQGLIF
jgi:hypothetical protein